MKSRLALDRGIRRRKIRPVEQRNSESFEPRALEVDHLLGVIVDDACRAHLPARRLLRIVLARLAGRVDAALENRVAAALPLGTRGREARLVRGLDLQRIDEAIAELIGQIDDLADDHLAVGFGEPRIAFGTHPLRGLLVDDPVGLERRALVVDLDAAVREDAVVGVVVLQFVRPHHHLRVRVGLASLEARRRGRNVRDRGYADPGRVRFRELGGRRTQAKHNRHGRSADQRHPPAASTDIPWPSVNRSGHYPSSWYKSTTKPVSPPASTGNHAATAACIRSALAKSSVIFDNT